MLDSRNKNAKKYLAFLKARDYQSYYMTFLLSLKQIMAISKICITNATTASGML